TLPPSPRYSTPALIQDGTVTSPQSGLENENGHNPPFLLISGYASHPIPARRPATPPSRRDELTAALDKIDLKAGDWNVRGVGHLARPFLGGNGSLSPSLGSSFWGSRSGTS